MTTAELDIRPLTPTIGAEVHGVDLSEDMSQETYAAIRQALLDHLVIFFRDQDVTLDQHKAFGKRFGELHVHPQGLRGDLAEHPDVLAIHADEHTKRVAGHSWHSDVSCDAEPPMGSVLRLHTVPPQGGDTLFANMYAAYDALSERMKTYLDGLMATHDGAPNYLSRARIDNLPVKDSYPANSHPVIRTHPETGRKCLFVNPVFTQRIDDIPEDESRAIPGLSVRALVRAEIPVSVPLGGEFDGVLGQPLRPAHRDGRLPPGRALRLPGDDHRRPAVLSTPKPASVTSTIPPGRRATRPRSTAVSQIGSRGQEVRQPSMTSA